MIELKDICVNYENHLIYQHAYFSAKHNELTLVIGKSGSCLLYTSSVTQNEVEKE